MDDKVVPIVPARFSRQCEICKRDLDTRRKDDVVQLVRGWANINVPGEDIRVDEYFDRWAHDSCVEQLEEQNHGV